MARGKSEKPKVSLQEVLTTEIRELSSPKVPAKPFLSVIVSVYNHARFIKHALESVLTQKVRFPFEVVITDDFSTDGTRDILRDFRRRYPDKIRLFLAS